MKKNISIAKKLFIITAIVFAVFLSSALIIESLFFERFYISKKKKDLKINIENFRVDYNKAENDDKIAEIIDEYESNNNIKIIMLDSTNELKALKRPTKDRMDLFKTRELTDFIMGWNKNPDDLLNLKQKNKTITLMQSSRENSSRNLISITPNNEKGEVIFALSSLQPVNEAVSVIQQFYLYFYIGAAVFIVILSFVYSNMIAKPLVKINKVATKMAQLDFAEKCEVKSQDEIGNVASSLNFLSENLDEALTSLRNANKKLEEDIDKERKLEKIRKEFVASVSHELKTPITLIEGYAVGLKDDIFEGKDKDFYLDIIIDETQKMGDLVSEMLDLSHLESGNFKLLKEEFDISQLIKCTLKKYGNLFDEKKANLNMNLIDGVKVYADYKRMEQVLTNFITNALRHVNENGTIYVNMVEEEDKISIEIENTGSSIPEDELPKVWDKFYKVDKSRNRKLGGTGIGLSIVKNILELHSYPFGALNTDKGVKFYFKVPKK